MTVSLLVLEDDPTVRRFVGMALQRLGAEAVLCATVAEATRALEGREFQAIVTDLRLPDGTGESFIAALAPYRQAYPACQVVVSSGALDPETRSRLQQLQVDQMLTKPLELQQLKDLVASAAEGARAAPPGPPPEGSPAQRALQVHFGGNERLFAQYRSLCLAQFPSDMAQADAALQRGDGAALQHTGHNLKTVLRLLGWEQPAELAARLEQQATTDAAAAATTWHALRKALEDLLRSG